MSFADDYDRETDYFEYWDEYDDLEDDYEDEDLYDDDRYYESDGQPDEYTEWQDVYGGDDWDQGQYDDY